MCLEGPWTVLNFNPNAHTVSTKQNTVAVITERDDQQRIHLKTTFRERLLFLGPAQRRLREDWDWGKFLKMNPTFPKLFCLALRGSLIQSIQRKRQQLCNAGD